MTPSPQSERWVGRNSARHASRGAAMMEYVLIAVVLGVGVLFVLSRFGGSIGGRWNEASKRVEGTTATGGGSADGSAGIEANSAQGAGGGSGVGQGTRSAATGQPEEEPTPGSPRPSDGKVRVGNFAFDFQTVVWLAVLIIVTAVLIVVQIFAAARKKPKTKV